MIRILTVGRLKAGWAKEACEDYTRRIGRFARLEVREIPDSDPQEEAKALRQALGGGPLVVCDRRGENWSSEELSRFLGSHGSPSFVLGGPVGLASDFRTDADHVFALGAVTLPHELARVVLLEQIYRGLSILRGHPYHRRG